MKAIFSFLLLCCALPQLLAQPDYKMAGPYKIVARDGEHQASKWGSERDMKAAYDCAVNGYTDKALEIINAYANTLVCLDGHDAPLCAIQGFNMVRAMTLLRSHQTPAWESMIRRAFIPMMEKFEADSPYANGNWGAIVNRLRMACGIFLKDSTMYKASVDYFMYGNDNGSLPKYISETGQCQETGRDQAHAQLGLGVMCDICAMAWEYGKSVNCKETNCKYHDLWSAFDNRLMHGIEYSARYNLGYDVPFQTWTDCTGLYNDWTEPGAMQRGHIRCIYDQPYEHYVNVKGLQMPYTKKLLTLQAKAEKRGEVTETTEAREFYVSGVKEGTKLHQVLTYPAPVGAPLKHDYEVFVQPRGSKEWTQIDTYMARVNAPIGDDKHKVSEISYAFFDFTGDVYVRVICKNKKYKTARIRPDYKGIIANMQNDSTVQFLLFQPENVSVEFDGNITNNLLLFTSKPVLPMKTAEKEAKKANRTFICYQPGLYTNDTIRISSNTTIYLCGGTYFTGTFAIDDVENVSILGRGIARPVNGYEGCHVYRSQNVLVDGLILNTCPMGESKNVTLHDIRSISHPSWGDGLNVFGGCSNILFDRVFCRNSDDCTTTYATRKGFRGSVDNVVMRNATLWADVAHPIFIGIHGDADKMDSITNLRYENIDILGQAEPQIDYQGCMAINCGDNNLVKNVTFDNIRIEEIEQGSLLHVKVGYNKTWCAAPGRGVENIRFSNIRYKGKEPNLSLILGYNEERTIKNIEFVGLKINGKKIYDDMPEKLKWYKTTDIAKMYVNDLVKEIIFYK